MKSTLEEGGGRSAMTHPPKKKSKKKTRRRKPSGSRSQTPPMANYGTKLGFQTLIPRYRPACGCGAGFVQEKLVDIGFYSIGDQARGFFLPEISAPPPYLWQDYE